MWLKYVFICIYIYTYLILQYIYICQNLYADTKTKQTYLFTFNMTTEPLSRPSFFFSSVVAKETSALFPQAAVHGWEVLRVFGANLIQVVGVLNVGS